MPSFPRTAFSQEPTSFEGTVHRRKAHRNTLVFQFLMNDFTTSLSLVSLFDNGLHRFSRKGLRVRLGSRAFGMNEPPPITEVFFAPLYHCPLAVAEPLGCSRGAEQLFVCSNHNTLRAGLLAYEHEAYEDLLCMAYT